MIVLALDTTGPDCSACLSQDDRVLAFTSERIGRGHAERLAPMVAELFVAADLARDAVDRIAVCTGPGSFTGLRVALSLAKGFALPRRLPVLGMDALMIEAATWPDARVAVFRDVKRGQVFAAIHEQGRVRVLPQAMSMNDAQALAAAHSAPLYPAERVDVRMLAQLAMAADPADHAADPLYARAPDAKLPGGKVLPAS
ncbi:tRNA (adenosine(37)-N6)-threonylcarbamoyltransferase complex dimerization subunit type 1 TsaB [Algimonas porphyrae]|uniref:tRNA (Adenosine(37)-N6)-threonylcarbamoyltransferase complex dimerization subunit type 1 TsaB n=1 Tax=Algimonas porphyrae TaxID=1128113 RepID=A0ABQ5UZD0_9PROT|nr:tRNA (adenosine(37)-N6)-threonylcarbamoyltransferase complex dimerization subunit type 1 TsaB [Algimonas porphyrae]GLQ20643.1 tRNA (adenosine(37)-N6)-threonylcarbamoyltransferase complex dimerization subunit type 1 TsaB [Algimonas porphyrae]